MNDLLRTSPASIEGAMSAFHRAVRAIEKLATAGAVGPDIEDLVIHATRLLDAVDEELVALDPELHAEAFEAAPVLRQKLDALRIELGIGEVP